MAVPLKGFHLAKGRLADRLDPARRRELVALVAGRVVAAASGTDAELVVATGDQAVTAWGESRGLRVLAEPEPGGLNAAAAAAASYARSGGRPWCIVHADLPLVTADHLRDALAAAAAGITTLAPSRVGGTNILASTGGMRFRYGPASFHRHLASVGHAPARVLMSVATALDLDTIDDLVAAAALPGGEWLAEFLT